MSPIGTPSCRFIYLKGSRKFGERCFRRNPINKKPSRLKLFLYNLLINLNKTHTLSIVSHYKAPQQVSNQFTKS